MRVIQAITSLGVGGAERVVLALASQRQDTNVHTAVVCFSSETDAIDVFGVPITAVVFDAKGGIAAAIVSLWRYSRFLRSFRPDLIHAHLFHAYLITAIAQILALRFTPIVFTLHSSSCPPVRSRVLGLTRRWRKADVVLSSSETRASWIGYARVIPNGVDVSARPNSRTWPGRPDTIFISVGRLVAEKCPVELLFGLARAGLPSWKLLMVGGGPLREQVDEAIQMLGLGGQVEMLGRRSDVRELLRSADVFLCYSDREGLPLSMLEAGAEGLVVVSTPVGSVPDLLGHDGGYLAEKERFFETLGQVVNDRSGALQRANTLRERVYQHYSTDVMIRAHLALYDEVCAPVAPGRRAA